MAISQHQTFFASVIKHGVLLDVNWAAVAREMHYPSPEAAAEAFGHDQRQLYNQKSGVPSYWATRNTSAYTGGPSGTSSSAGVQASGVATGETGSGNVVRAGMAEEVKKEEVDAIGEEVEKMKLE